MITVCACSPSAASSAYACSSSSFVSFAQSRTGAPPERTSPYLSWILPSRLPLRPTETQKPATPASPPLSGTPGLPSSRPSQFPPKFRPILPVERRTMPSAPAERGGDRPTGCRTATRHRPAHPCSPWRRETRKSSPLRPRPRPPSPSAVPGLSMFGYIDCIRRIHCHIVA